VTTDDDIPLVESLIGSQILGVDIEWRPQLTKFMTQRPATLQISGKSHACVIDLISLVQSQRLDKALTLIFRDTNTILVGLAFKNDLTLLRKHLPHLEFPKSVANHCDAADLHAKMQAFNAKKAKELNPDLKVTPAVVAGTLKGIV